MYTTIRFDDVKFFDNDNFVRGIFVNRFFFDLDKKKLLNISDFKIVNGSIVFFNSDEGYVKKNFFRIFDFSFTNNLKSLSFKKQAYYIFKDSNIPLLGVNSFGLTDRNTNLIEVKPMTGCNLGCVYCSVHEGIGSNRITDYIIQPEYLAEKFEELVKFKNVSDVEAYFTPHGEPLLYPFIVKLVSLLNNISGVSKIAINTNGVLLNEKLILDLEKAGLSQFNISLNAFSKSKADLIANTSYPVSRVKSMIEFILKYTNISVVVAPVLLRGFNEDELEKIVFFVKSLEEKYNKKVVVGIQNFLYYKEGRNPSKPFSWSEFDFFIKSLEEKTGKILKVDEEDFNIYHTKKLPMPFKKGSVVDAFILFPERLKGYSVAVDKDYKRLISVKNFKGKKGKVKVKIVHAKHNIFRGEVL